MTRTHLRARLRPQRFSMLAALTAVIAALALHATPASASSSQVALIQDGLALNNNPGQELATMKGLGANTLRVLLYWWQVAPSPNAKSAPKGFKASDPGAYPARNWAQWDSIVRTAATEGIRVDLDITGAPPNWAQGKGVPSHFIRERFGWDPNAGDYGQFVRAVATRYSGHFTPAGASSPLPKVSLYSIWNEPNYGQNLGPQNVGANSHSAGYPVAPLYYRNLVRAGYSALRATAKGATVLIGELAGTGKGPYHTTRQLPQGLPGQVSIAAPIPYIQELYCLNSSYRPLTGKVAQTVGCPTGGARGSFVKNNPGLFDASAFSMHPYGSHYTPNAKSGSVPPNDIVFPVIGRLENELTRVTGAWHHTRRYNIWSTEFGYITSPPQTNRGGPPYPSPKQAAIYLNQAEYISYHNPRLVSYAQYLLADPANQRYEGVGLFSSGLLFSNGKPKPGYFAYRMPVWLPKQAVKRGQTVPIWGGARPAPGGYMATKTPQHVLIQLHTGGAWRTIETVTAAKSNGYFNARYRFTVGGGLRLAYTYPTNELQLPLGLAGTTIYSRIVPVSVH